MSSTATPTQFEQQDEVQKIFWRDPGFYIPNIIFGRFLRWGSEIKLQILVDKPQYFQLWLLFPQEYGRDNSFYFWVAISL